MTNSQRSFQTRGVIVSIPAGASTVVIRHEAIAGFMPSMTMEFNVRKTNELHRLRPGDLVVFQITSTDDESWVESIRRTMKRSNLLPIDAVPERRRPVPGIPGKIEPGDVMTDFEFESEDGVRRRLSDFRGTAVAFTFFFTRCPLPDFCPRMNHNFVRARELLIERSTGPTNWQFLSLSFDPEYDRPEVLGRYARGYRGAAGDHWLFGAAPTNTIAILAPGIDFHWADHSGVFAHNLRTVVVDSQRRLFRRFDGNQWTPEQLADALLAAAGKR